MDKFNFIDNSDDKLTQDGSSNINNSNDNTGGFKKNNKYFKKKNKSFYKKNYTNDSNKRDKYNKYNNHNNNNNNDDIEYLEEDAPLSNFNSRDKIIVDEKKDNSEEKDFEKIFEEEIENLEFTQEFLFDDEKKEDHISDEVILDNHEGDNLDYFDDNDEFYDSKIDGLDSFDVEEEKVVEEDNTPKVTLMNHDVGANGFSEDTNLDTYKFSDDEVSEINNSTKSVENPENDYVAFDKDSWAVNSSLGKVHFSYQFRVACLIVGILVLFISSCAMIFTALRINIVKDSIYSDSSKTSYKVCGESCAEPNLEYEKDSTEKVVVNFSYDALFADNINYDLKFRVVLYNRIYDGNKVIYEDKNIIIENDTIKKKDKAYNYDTRVSVDYKKYSDFVLNYEKYNDNSNALIDVILYVDSEDGSREVSSITIPVGKDKFKIDTNDTVKTEHSIRATTSDWTGSNTLIVVIGSLLIIMSLFLLFRLTRLVLATLSRKSKYERELVSIFNEYDKYLVVARGGYESDIVKNVVKVDSFNEMLNVREILNKPIIFSKINNVKSEFIIDDDDLIYKFVLKEADIEE